MKIMAITTNFGFGPVSKLKTIIDTIKQYNKDVIIDFYGNGESVVFLKDDKNISNFIFVDPIKDAKFIAKKSNEYDLVINVMYVEILKYLSNTKAKIYFVDSLSFLWNEPFKYADVIDRYFVQNFVMDESNIKNMKVNYEIINPIVSNNINNKSIDESLKNSLLVNFSGLHDPFKKRKFFIEFARIHLNLITDLFKNDFDNIYISSNEEIALSLSKESDLNIKFYKHDEFLKMCSSVNQILSLSGITFYLEKEAAGLKVAYLLPSNYSQLILNKKYRNEFNENCILLEDFGEEFFIPDDLEEKEGVFKVEEKVLEILHNHKNEYKDMLKKILKATINSKKEDSITEIKFGQYFILDKIIEDFLQN